MAARALRADARRNRERILAAAAEAFAGEGTEVPLDTIAERAGVGAGTVHRHFPTKEALIAAVVAGRLERLAARAEALGTDPAADFHEFVTELAADARENLALTEVLGGELPAEAAEPAARLSRSLDALLRTAQRAGAVRPDLTLEELHAILGGVIAMERRLPEERRGLGLEVVLAGLRPA